MTYMVQMHAGAHPARANSVFLRYDGLRTMGLRPSYVDIAIW